MFKSRKSSANYDSDPAQIVLWLWHGSASVQEECRTGFDTAYANMEDNVYGAGFDFAFDPRLSMYFQRATRNREDVNKVFTEPRLQRGVTSCRSRRVTWHMILSTMLPWCAGNVGAMGCGAARKRCVCFLGVGCL